MPRNYIKKHDSRRKEYSSEALIEAVAKVKAKELSSYKAADEYGIPRSTIARHILGIKSSKIGEGRPNRFPTHNEEELVHLVKAYAEFGFGLQKKEFMEIVIAYVEKTGLEDKFKDGKPGDEWYQNFMKRWKHEISLRTPELLTLTRALACNKTVVDAWFKLVKHTLEKLDILDKPAQILNCDETGLNTNPKNKKIICKRGTKNPVTIAPGSGKEQYTVLSTISAAGKNFPPFILYAGKNLYKEWMTGGPVGTLYGVTVNGWMETAVFTEYFQCLVKWLEKTPKPVLMVFDGHMSHISLQTVELAIQNKITILCLPAHCSHLLQPLDIGIFRQVKTTWREILAKYYKESRLKAVGKATFPSLVKKLYDQSFKPAHIVQSFSKAGLFPFDPSAVATDKLKPAEIFDRPAPVPVPALETDDDLELAPLPLPLRERMANTGLPIPPVIIDIPTTSGSVIRDIVKEQLTATKADARAAKRPTKQIKRRYGGECLTSEAALERLISEQENEKPKARKKMPKKRLVNEKNSSSEEEEGPSCSNAQNDSNSSENEDEAKASSRPRPIGAPEVGSWIIVEYEVGQRKKHYIGQIEKKEQEDAEEVVFHVSFLQRVVGSGFIWPSKKDADIIEESMIKCVLAEPDLGRRETLIFVNISDYFH